MRSANVQAVILGANEKTVSVLMPWEDKKMVYDKGKLLDYAFAEDHGIWLKFYDQGEKVAAIEIVWDDLSLGSEDEEKPELTPNVGQVLIEYGFVTEEAGQQIDTRIKNLKPSNFEGYLNLSDELGKLLELFDYEWKSGQDIEYRLDDLREFCPGLIIIH